MDRRQASRVLKSVVPRVDRGFRINLIGASDLPADAKRKLANVVASCTECRSLREGDHTSAPSLAKVFESDIASNSYKFCSQALLGAKGKWTAERLAAFISDPQQIASGTTMPPPSGLD